MLKKYIKCINYIIVNKVNNVKKFEIKYYPGL